MADLNDEAQWSQKPAGAKASLGQFSFAPATQTTVVTTTTTTTTAFPPFILRAPRDLSKRDPDVYPLAAGPTPASLKKITFEMGGQVAQFEEVEDGSRALQEYAKEQAQLKANHGTFQSFHCMSGISEEPIKASKQPLSRVHSSVRRRFRELESIRKQSATPISLPDDTDASNTEDGEFDGYDAPNKLEIPKIQPKQMETDFDIDESPSLPGAEFNPRKHLEQRTAFQNFRSEPQSPETGSIRPFVGSATPPKQYLDDDSPIEETLNAVRSRPAGLGIDTVSAQDASLPSPSLSPIAAAAQLGRRTNPGGLHQAISTQASSYFDTVSASSSRSASSMTSLDQQLHAQSLPKKETNDQLSQGPSFSDIPSMLDNFDTMPEKLQSYVMYQLLRRCSKDMIHFVADTIAPALKVDFFKRLPLELSQQIVGFLDVRSLCCAAQVSRKWREVIDSDEKAWMNLVKTDGYRLAPNEIDQAVREGWGWQYPKHDGDWEVDLSRSKHVCPRSSRRQNKSPSNSPQEETEMPSSSLKRKRTESTCSSTISKKLKHRSAPSPETSEEMTHMPSLVDLGKAHGPNALASLATLAVPDPKIGIRSLRRLSLFKSLYRRHHLLKNSWLKPNSKPKHIAFRAHEGHVVTCLQFDSDKILTGSDNAVIDIYDTATGTQRKRLEGHEGGVWALEYQDNMLVSGSTDRSVRIWDMDTGECLHVFQGHTSTVRCLQIVQPVKVGTRSDGRPIMMPPSRLIITGSRDSTCRIWKLPKMGDRSVIETGQGATTTDNPYFVRSLAGHTHSVRAIAAHGDILVSGSYDSTVRVWSISTGETLFRLQGHTTKVYSVVLDHERKRCISGSMDTVVKVWSIETGECLFNLHGHNSLVGLLDLKDDILVSAAADSTLKIWDPERGKIRHTLRAHTGAITCFAHDGQKVISGSERTLKMWNTRTGKCVRDLLTDLRGVWQVRFDERRCIAAVHRGDWTYIEVLDFGAAGDGVPERDRGRRIVVDADGAEMVGRAAHELNAAVGGHNPAAEPDD